MQHLERSGPIPTIRTAPNKEIPWLVVPQNRGVWSQSEALA